MGTVTLDHAALLLFALLSVTYFAQAMVTAADTPLWMDEILTLWTARRPDVAAIWSALVRGAEFTPPLYDCFVHGLQQLGITSALGLRFPSIVAIYVVSLATGSIAYRYTGVASAALAAGIVLSSGLFGYAVQVRPYAMVTAAFACALALCDRPDRLTNKRLALIGALLVLAIALHFYALLLAGGLALFVLARSLAQRRSPPWRLVGVIALSCSSILLWWPILIAARAYSHADVSASGYYARPVLLSVVRTYAMLLGNLIFPLIALLAATALFSREKSGLRATALAVAAVPLVIFAFAASVSHSYADRYALVGGIGIALLFASLVQQLGKWATAASVTLLALLMLMAPWRSTGETGKRDRLEALSTAASPPAPLPIVTGSGLRFFEISENVPSAHITFLDAPGQPSEDPTNLHQVRRWRAIDPRLRIASAQAFACAHPVFYLFSQPPNAGPDTLVSWLAAHADFVPPPSGRASLTLVHARPCAANDANRQ